MADVSLQAQVKQYEHSELLINIMVEYSSPSLHGGPTVLSTVQTYRIIPVLKSLQSSLKTGTKQVGLINKRRVLVICSSCCIGWQVHN